MIATLGHPWLIALAAAGADVTVPETAAVPVLLDGRIGAREWVGATALDPAPGLRLLLRQSGGHVYIAVDTPGTAAQPMDLSLVAADGVQHQLHASMQLAERVIGADGEAPEWRWGNQVDWLASTMRRDPLRRERALFAEQLYRADGTEWQIDRARFPGAHWRVRLTVDAIPGAERAFAYPEDSVAEDPSTWALWGLGEEPVPAR
jgi:hypothetical protein